MSINLFVKLAMCGGIGYGIWLVTTDAAATQRYGTIGAVIYLSSLIVFAFLEIEQRGRS